MNDKTITTDNQSCMAQSVVDCDDTDEFGGNLSERDISPDSGARCYLS